MVLPYCILNVGIYFLINWLNEKEHIHIDISSQGHSLMSLIIAFLGVSKVNIALTRYMDSKHAIKNADILKRNKSTCNSHNREGQQPSSTIVARRGESAYYGHSLNNNKKTFIRHILYFRFHKT